MKFKKLLSIVLTLILLIGAVTTSVSASRETAGVAVWFGDEVSWWEDTDVPNTLYFSGTGAIYDFDFENPTQIQQNYINEIESGLFDREFIVVEYGITYIGENIFTLQKNTKEVTIADSVVSIHDNAFSKDSQITIKAGADSYAIEYAKQKGLNYEIIEFNTPGDVNSDHAVNGKDVLALRKYIVGLTDSIDVQNADVNNDGQINGKDVLQLRKALIGLVKLTPVESPSDIVVETPDNI